MKLKRLFLDIETSPNKGWFWRTGFKIQISADNIIEERKIVCVGFKWAGEKRVHALHWDENMNDRSMLEALLPILNEADEIVMHNGDKFDLPWIRTRCLFHRLPMPPDHKTVDTLQWARRKFYFNSNRLDYISKYAGRKGKLKTSFKLWELVCGQNDRKKLAYMVRYCRGDVLELEAAYDVIAPYVSHKTHAGVLEGHDKWSCPHCASENIGSNGVRVTASGTKYYRMHCKDCCRLYRINDVAHGRWLKKDDLKKAA